MNISKNTYTCNAEDLETYAKAIFTDLQAHNIYADNSNASMRVHGKAVYFTAADLIHGLSDMLHESAQSGGEANIAKSMYASGYNLVNRRARLEECTYTDHEAALFSTTANSIGIWLAEDLGYLSYSGIANGESVRINPAIQPRHPEDTMSAAEVRTWRVYIRLVFSQRLHTLLSDDSLVPVTNLMEIGPRTHHYRSLAPLDYFFLGYCRCSLFLWTKASNYHRDMMHQGIPHGRMDNYDRDINLSIRSKIAESSRHHPHVDIVMQYNNAT
ncbi:MAG: hypothetical protein RLN60_03345 [Phycisphaerales bacterium]